MLKCDLCNKKKEPSHLTISLEYQASVLNGGHLHICSDCREGYYGKDIIEKLKNINLAIIKDYKDKN